MVLQQLSTNTFGVAKWVVSGDNTQGTHSTIATAMATAMSGDTIWVRDGTYTENVTLTAGVALVGESPNAIVLGTLTATAAGTFTLQNLTLETNSAASISVTGSNAVVLNVSNCYLQPTNGTGISVNNANAVLAFSGCMGGQGANAVAMFAVTTCSSLALIGCDLAQNGASSTASTFAAGSLGLDKSKLSCLVQVTGGSLTARYAVIKCDTQNATALALTNSATLVSHHSKYLGGTATALTAGASTTVEMTGDVISSTNASPITLSGTITRSNDVLVMVSGQIINHTAPGAYPYTVLATDFVVRVDTTSARTINLPNAPVSGTTWIIKDITGTASTNFISVMTPGGTVTIDGVTTFTINQNRMAIRVLFDGSNYQII